MQLVEKFPTHGTADVLFGGTTGWARAVGNPTAFEEQGRAIGGGSEQWEEF